MSSQMSNNTMVGGTDNILIPNCMQSGGEEAMWSVLHPERLLPLVDLSWWNKYTSNDNNIDIL